MGINHLNLLIRLQDLIKIDSETGHEEQMHAYLDKYLRDEGLEVKELGHTGETGSLSNLYATLPGDETYPTLLFNAHMDTVTPGIKKFAYTENNRMHSDGTTILGADDFAGIAIILEMIETLKLSRIPHGTIRFLFTVGEEAGLTGARKIEKGDIQADYAYVLDDAGTAGTYTCSAPAHDKFEIHITGKAAHAGVEPEAGVSAISIFAKALTLCPIGRIDEVTTCNIGVVKGGQAMNIVCPEIDAIGEARSNVLEKLDAQSAKMEEAFTTAAKEYGGHVDFKRTRLYYPIEISESSPIALRLARAAEENHITLNPVTCGGGTDGSVIVGHGIPSVTLAIGYYKMHTTEEYLDLHEFYKAADLAWSLATDTQD